jgi:outer membrane protein assembly factor BamD
MLKNKPLLIWCLLICLITAISGCKSQFEKLLESNNNAKKNQEAMRLYNKKDYSRALLLFEDLMKRYRGREEAEELSYYFAYANYYVKDYTTARYQFKVFADTYPSSQRAEECRYMAAYCYYLESPNYSLDQGNTLKAIEALQLFINLYPKSERVDEATKLIDELRDKLERKSYENAKLYLDIATTDITYYRSAVIAFKNSLRDFPDTKYAEDMEFLIIKAQYLYAKNSLPIRQEERYSEVIALYNEFIEDYPKSKYSKDAEDFKINAEQGIAEAKKTLASEQSLLKQKEVAQKDTVSK